jgi:fibronectin-binding autotransporter adhesin
MRSSRASTRIAVAAAVMSALPLAMVGGEAAGAWTGPSRPASSPACEDSWTNSAGGDWFTQSGQPSNWSTGAPPAMGQYACINIALSGPVVLNDSTTVAGLSLGNTSGTGGTDVLDLDSNTLSLASGSNVTRAGQITATVYGSIDMGGSSVLTNDGDMQVWGIWGNVTNQPDGLVTVPDGDDMVLFTGTLTNLGEFTVEPGSTGLYIPSGSSTGAVFDNAGGVLQNQGAVDVSSGGTFTEGAGLVIGTPPLISGAGVLDLAGAGASSFELQGGYLGGKVGAGQTLVLGNGQTQTTGSLTSDGTILTTSSPTLTIPSGDTLTNDGSIVVPAGNNVDLDGDVTNGAAGTIAVAATSSTGASLTLGTGDTLTNDGTVTVGPLSGGSLDAGEGTIDNAGGSIANAGQITVPDGGTLVQGAGATTGNPVLVSGGALDLTGGGAASAEMQGGTISGNVAHGQTVELIGGGGTTDAAGSFTNDGTLVANSTLSLPSGDTLTNDSTIEAGDGDGANGFTVNGNLTNAAGGVIGENGGGVNMTGTGTTFDNAGTLYDLYQNNIDVNLCNHQPCGNTFDSTGTIYEGTNSSGAEWGNGAYASDVSNTSTGDTVDLGGTIVPVPDGEPSGGSGSSITYGLTNDSPGSPPAWALSCSAGITSGWSLACSNGSGAVLTEPESATLEPTEVSVSGSGTSQSYGWESVYGQPVTLSATVSAEGGGTPTGTVTFYAAQQYSSTSFDYAATGPDLLGTGTLSTTGGVTTATLTTSSLPPGEYQLLALYGGDSADLAASSVYSSSDEQLVTAQTSTVALTSSANSPVFGTPLTLTATVTPGGYGPADPTGLVTFFDGNTIVGQAPVSTSGSVTTAKFATTALPTGSDSLTADYTGDYNYEGSTSSKLSQSVSAPTAPTTVTVTGPSTVKAGKTYKAKAKTDGTGAVLFALSSSPAPPPGMTINASTGAVSFKVPASGLSSFSYAVVAANAAGQAQSSAVTVTVS